MTSKEDLVEQLLVFPEGHPYQKWTGTHWRLVEMKRPGFLAVLMWVAALG